MRPRFAVFLHPPRMLAAVRNDVRNAGAKQVLLVPLGAGRCNTKRGSREWLPRIWEQGVAGSNRPPRPDPIFGSATPRRCDGRPQVLAWPTPPRKDEEAPKQSLPPEPEHQIVGGGPRESSGWHQHPRT